MQQLRSMLGILLTLLNADRPVPRKELAKKFEISERSVSRYVDAMSADCDIPITASYGNGGGYQLADNYKLEQTFFTNDEYERLLSCISAFKKDFDDGIMKSLEEKLNHLSANAREARKYLLRNDRLVIDSSAWLNPTKYRGTIGVINKAIEKSRTLFMIYVDKHDSRSERLFDPYSLVLKEGVWYVYGWCHSRKDFRLFKLSRIKELSYTDSVFELKEGSDVYAKLSEEFIHRSKVSVTLSFDSEALPAIEEWLGVDGITRDENNGYIASGYVYSEDLLIKKLLALGSHVKVLSPDYVAEELQIEMRRALNRYF